MKYIFSCDCGNLKEIEKEMSKDFKDVICEKCNCKMKQDFRKKKLNLDIPCTFDSFGDYAPKDYGESNLEEKMIDIY